jgi:hypothetical protein
MHPKYLRYMCAQEAQKGLKKTQANKAKAPSAWTQVLNKPKEVKSKIAKGAH